jgi:hypothetical protein
VICGIAQGVMAMTSQSAIQESHRSSSGNVGKIFGILEA